MARIEYDSERMPKLAYQLALLGATFEQIARVFEISISKLRMWRRDYREFDTALNMGRMEADSNVAASLYQCAMGYSYPEERLVKTKDGLEVVTINKFKPRDAWAAAKWLAVRQRGLWSEVKQTAISQTNVNVAAIDLSVLTTEELEIAKKLGLTSSNEELPEAQIIDNEGDTNT